MPWRSGRTWCPRVDSVAAIRPSNVSCASCAETNPCSREAVRLLSLRSSSRIWAELHEKAFRRLGGSTRIVVLDNLKEGVLVPDIYDPALNPLFHDVLTHY